jgi:acetyl-CoA carboxylase biotin carboxylase subunit
MKVLIANRGEIALRILSTLKRLRLGSVAVYSDPDRNLRYVREADESVSLGGSRAQENYLVIEKILDAAHKTGAQAIHPGYGFLAENAEFAQAVRAAGFRFIGPRPESIALMGDKGRARETMARAGLPMLPAFSLEGRSEREIAAFAEEAGYPVLVKARFGGGGIGMSIVKEASKLQATLQKVQDAAKRSFGKGDVYVEKYLSHAKHIEFQIAADDHGAVVCLGARECSVQRRHQKLIEESPSPLEKLQPGKIDKIQDTVVHALTQIGYSNLGTVEMLADAATGEFYFLEMNTRLQVEHRVTEQVTGFDLVEFQLRLADGEKLSSLCPEIRKQGHAIEFRICAEDPKTFFPSPGKITDYQEPQGTGILVDSGFGAGDEITPFYDSLLAKLVVHAADRAGAISKAKEALAGFRIEGIKHNIPFHLRALSEERFLTGEYDTHFIEAMK